MASNRNKMLNKLENLFLSNLRDALRNITKSSYKLKSLEEVDSYIQTNKHLPDVPSAEEVVCDGIDMAKMDAKLLQKIEELTLYLIELKKENQVIKAELINLKK